MYIGVPARVKALAEAGTIKLSSKRFKSVVFDCKANKKGFTLFETHETRDDTFGLLMFAQKQLRKRKLQIYLS